jgi:hypothetical protein
MSIREYRSNARGSSHRLGARNWSDIQRQTQAERSREDGHEARDKRTKGTQGETARCWPFRETIYHQLLKSDMIQCRNKREGEVRVRHAFYFEFLTVTLSESSEIPLPNAEA